MDQALALGGRSGDDIGEPSSQIRTTSLGAVEAGGADHDG